MPGPETAGTPREPIPPHNLDAERAVLGAVLLEGRPALTRAAEVLTAHDFYADGHRAVFRVMLEMAERPEAIDLVTLTERLRRADELDAVGGPAAVAGLIEEAAIAAHLDEHVRIVHELATKREVIRRAADLMRHAYDGTAATELTSMTAAFAEEIRDRALAGSPALAPRSLAEVLEAVVAQLRAGRAKVLRTPFAGLNALLAGGFRAGELIYLGARPGLGKTAMALEMATAAARAGEPTLVVSREMLLEALGRRIIAQTAHISAMALRAGVLDAHDWALIDRALPALRGLPLWFTDRLTSITQIEALVAAARERHGVTLVIIDYLQLVRAPREIRDRRLGIEHISQSLKSMALEHALTVLCLSSLSRTRDEKGRIRRPTLADLRESGELEHDADIVCFLHKPGDGQETELIMAKGREVATGIVNLLYFGSILTFEEQSRQAGDEEVPF